jgi:hypothetical protein
LYFGVLHVVHGRSAIDKIATSWSKCWIVDIINNLNDLALALLFLIVYNSKAVREWLSLLGRIESFIRLWSSSIKDCRRHKAALAIGSKKEH